MVHSLKMQRRFKTLRFFLRLIESQHSSLDKYDCSELVLEENLHARSLRGVWCFCLRTPQKHLLE